MIKRITIKDFKSIRDQTVELDPVTVLVGRSGTGKSNFVQALRFLRNCLLSYNEAIAVEGGWERIVPAGTTAPELLIEVVLELAGRPEEYAYQLAFRPDGQFAQNRAMAPAAESLRVGGEAVFDRARDKTKGWHWRKPPNTVAVPRADADFAITHLPALPDAVYAYTALSSSIGYYNLPTAVLGCLAPEPVHHQKNINQHLAGLRDDASNYLEVMREIARDLHRPELRQSLLASLQQLNPGVRSVELDSITDPRHAVVGHASNGKVLDIRLDQESDGFRRFYTHLLALYQRPAKLTNVFEEPENGIYPGALALLADEFKAAPAAERGQVILTTHSPGLLDQFDVDNLRVVELRGNETVIGRVAHDQREAVKANLLRTGELLTVDRARIEEPDAAPEGKGA